MMTNHTIYHQVGIRSDIKSIYAALTTTEGLSAWWTDCTGESNMGGELHFDFGEIVIPMMVSQLEEGYRVGWRCMTSDGEWAGTEVHFELLQEEDQVTVNFMHSEWRSCTALFAHCSTKWAVFMLSLKSYIEDGKGMPFPDDIKIDYS